jgi:hypothetical protein
MRGYTCRCSDAEAVTKFQKPRRLTSLPNAHAYQRLCEQGWFALHLNAKPWLEEPPGTCERVAFLSGHQLPRAREIISALLATLKRAQRPIRGSLL